MGRRPCIRHGPVALVRRLAASHRVAPELPGTAGRLWPHPEFPPGAAHDVHRHPNAEKTEYLVEGHGIARVGHDDVLVGPGDIVFASADEYHGFINTSDTERAVMVWCYGGAASLAEAGYVREADDTPT